MNAVSTLVGELFDVQLGMSDQKAVRLERLREVLAKRQVPDRERTAYLLTRLGGHKSYWSGLIAGDRPFGDKIARKIEEALSLGRGYLDDLREGESPSVRSLGKAELELLKAVGGLDALDIGKVIGFAMSLRGGESLGEFSAPQEERNRRAS